MVDRFRGQRLLAVLAIVALVGCDFRNDVAEEPWRTLVDGRGDSVVLHQPARRIVSLAPNGTETVAAVGGLKYLVAVTEFCDEPPAVAALPKVAGFDAPSIERLVQLNPDLVVASDITTAATVERMRRAGLTVMVLKGRTLDDIEADLHRVAEALGGNAEPAARRFRRWRTEVRQRLPRSAVEAPRVVLTFGRMETYAAGAGTFMDDLLREVGAVNLAAKAPGAWPRLSREWLLKAQPDVLLVTLPEINGVTRAPEAVLAQYRTDPVWRQLHAVQNGRVLALDNDAFTVPAPSLGPMLWELAAALWPGQFPSTPPVLPADP